MNRWHCHSKPHGTGFRSIVSRADRADSYFLTDGGVPVIFGSVEAAELAGYKHLAHLWNTELRFTEPAVSGAKVVSAQEKAFGTVRNRKGKNATVRRRQQRRDARQKAAEKA